MRLDYDSEGCLALITVAFILFVLFVSGVR